MIATFTPEGRVSAAMRTPGALLVLYDEECELCRRCRHWLEHERSYVPIRFLGAASREATERFGDAVPWLGAELVVVSDRGDTWVGPAAFLVCLWATVRYRDWSYRLSGPAFAPMAESFFHAVSSRRRSIAKLLGPPKDECVDGRCRHRR